MSIDVGVFNRQFDTSIFGSLLNVFNLPTTVKTRVRSSNGGAQSERTATIPSEDILQFERIIEEAIQELECRTVRVPEPDAEVFDLRPLSTKRVAVKIRRVEPARFYFVLDDVLISDSDN